MPQAQACHIMMHPTKKCGGSSSTLSVAGRLVLLHAFCERTAAEAVEVLVTAAGTTASQQPEVCVDVKSTGVRFDGTTNEANCHALQNYCNYQQGTIAMHIQESCAKTCGRCSISENHAVPLSHAEEGSMSCIDQATETKPVFTIGDIKTACKDLKAFCHGHPDSEYVIHKCGQSCGVCPAVYTQGKDYRRTCQRRRRWGFCATRRRGFTIYQGGGIGEDHDL